MLSLPSLAPQDSYTLWYTSSRSDHLPPPSDPSTTSDNPNSNPHNPSSNSQNHRRHLLHNRTPLARLRLDEENLERRKQNVCNYGITWIKPPGVPKSLGQMRDEERELKEHQEALRREALAQELAAAEARELEELAAAQEGGVADGEAEGEVVEGRDLDDDIPEAEVAGNGADSDIEPDEDEENDNENNVQRGLRNTIARIPDDVYREALVRGEEIRARTFAAEEDSVVDEGDQAQMLREEDLLPSHNDTYGQEDMDMDMGVDLDADIPEAEAEGYEHTDTEEELTSSDDDDNEGNLPGRYPVASSMVRSDGTQNSLDLSSVLASGSSQVGSSPRQRRDDLRVRRRP